MEGNFIQGKRIAPFPQCKSELSPFRSSHKEKKKTSGFLETVAMDGDG